jgi:hypothetical protein
MMTLEQPWKTLLGELKLAQTNDGTVVAICEANTKRFWHLAYFAAKAYQLAALEYPTISSLVFLDRTEAIDFVGQVDLIGIAHQ